MAKKIRVKKHKRKTNKGYTTVKSHLRNKPENRKVEKISQRVKELHNYFNIPLNKAIKLERLLYETEMNGNYEDIDNVMAKMNGSINGYGVEALTDENHDNVPRYYGNIVGLYVNKGNTYDTTIIYDTAEGRFIIANWGDFIESYDEEH